MLDRDALTPNADYVADLRRNVGIRLTRVRYVLTEFSSRYHPADLHGVIEEVDHAVELSFHDQQVIFKWNQEGEREWLSVAEGAATELPWSPPRLIDVTNDSNWTLRMGRCLVRLGVSVMPPWGEVPESLWAVRMEFSDAPPVVVTLGELENGRPEYLPTALLVFFSKDAAQDYELLGSTHSAWGGIVADGRVLRNLIDLFKPDTVNDGCLYFASGST